MLQFRRSVDMNLKLHFVYFGIMIIKNGICHQMFPCGFPKRAKHFVFVKTFLSVWSFFLEMLTTLKKTNKIRQRMCTFDIKISACAFQKYTTGQN